MAAGRLKVWNEASSSWDYAGGGGGSLPDPVTQNVTIDSTDETQPFLTLDGTGAADGTTLFKTLKDDGSQGAHLENDGGGGFAGGHIEFSEHGSFVIGADVALGPGSTVLDARKGGGGLMVIAGGSGNEIITLSAGDDTDNILVAYPNSGTHTGDLVRIYDKNFGLCFKVAADGTVHIKTGGTIVADL